MRHTGSEESTRSRVKIFYRNWISFISIEFLLFELYQISIFTNDCCYDDNYSCNQLQK